ncbi:peptidoglycan-binding domain-containing protein [Aurantimonas sp. C2-3-R2]|uniref:peptidoglycan-binding domain-containing protein n=1 Tax=Aurantimonas sp. C2-3-R2 TaxID=3114363 RepID=UPI002E173D25|nr:peptidoglycan-binding domain-containing protein [Aurantimonas sp. C2-3-R2]
MIKLGYEPGAPDGIAGAQTTEAIKSFQKEAGLQPSGDINEALIRALLARKDG